MTTRAAGCLKLCSWFTAGPQLYSLKHTTAYWFHICVFQAKWTRATKIYDGDGGQAVQGLREGGESDVWCQHCVNEISNMSVGDELFNNTVLETFHICQISKKCHICLIYQICIKYLGRGRLVWQHGAGEEQEVCRAGRCSCCHQVSQYH